MEVDKDEDKAPEPEPEIGEVQDFSQQQLAIIEANLEDEDEEEIGIHIDLIHLQELPNLTSPYPGSGAVYSCISKLHSVKVYTQLGKAQVQGLIYHSGSESGLVYHCISRLHSLRRIYMPYVLKSQKHYVYIYFCSEVT